MAAVLCGGMSVSDLMSSWSVLLRVFSTGVCSVGVLLRLRCVRVFVSACCMSVRCSVRLWSVRGVDIVGFLVVGGVLLFR